MGNEGASLESIAPKDFLVEFLSPHEVSPATKRRVDFFLSYLKGMRVLDVGCGAGFISRLLVRSGFDVTSIEVSPTYANLFKLAGTAVGIENPLILASITNLPLKDGTFDTIICSEVLEHVPQVEEAYEEFSRVLKKGGRLCISVPGITYSLIDSLGRYLRSRHSGWFNENLGKLEPTYHNKGTDLGHINRFTPAGLSATLAKYGFRGIAVENGYFLSHFVSAFSLGVLGWKRKDIATWEAVDTKLASHLPLLLGGNWLLVFEKQ